MISLALAGALILADNANPGGLPPEKVAAMQPAIHTYLACLIVQARQIDDQVSDAQTIATAIGGQCSDELRGVMNAVELGDTPEERSIDETTAGHIRQDATLEAVLVERRLRHAANSN